MEGNILKEQMRVPAGGAALPDLLSVDRERLVAHVIAGGCLGHNSHKIIISILREVRSGDQTKKEFQKRISNIRRTKEDLHLLLYEGGNTATKNE